MKAIFFDFDGTLTYTSLNFWKKLWATLGYDIGEGSYYKKLFNDAYAGKITHQRWCDLICKAFRKAGLTDDMLADIANTIDVMDGFDETMKTLKDRGYTLFIVSGNIKEVIEYNLREKKYYFTHIFGNEFKFDNKGLLKKIIGTKYDNQGKAELIKKFSKKSNTPMSDIWFVGNGGNDEWVYETGCKTLLINPYDTKKHDDNHVWHKQVKGVENLTAILDILND